LNKGAPSRSSMPILDHAAGTAAKGKPALCLGRMSRSLVYQPVCGVVRTISSVELGAGDGKDAMLLMVVSRCVGKTGTPAKGEKVSGVGIGRVVTPGTQLPIRGSAPAKTVGGHASHSAKIPDWSLHVLYHMGNCILSSPKLRYSQTYSCTVPPHRNIKSRSRCVEVAYKPRYINLVFERSATRS
jgi:hypothetical protein